MIAHRRYSRPFRATTAGIALSLLIGLPSAAIAQTAPAPAQQPAPNAAPATPAITEPSGITGERNASYTDRIPPEQLVTLEAGTEKFAGRHIADLSGLPRGAVIVLHDSGQHPSWPLTVAALLDELPLHGWDTLSIELPLPAAPLQRAEPSATPPATDPAAAPAGTPPPASPAPAAATAPATGAPAPRVTDVEAQAAARIAAALKYFSEQQQGNIVLIGIGSGATRAAELIRHTASTTADKSVAPITTLVMIAPRNTLPGIELDLPKILPATDIPVLDITLDSSPQTRADAEARRRAVLHQRTRVYRRMELPPINSTSNAQHSVLVKRVRAWLQRDEEVATGQEK